MFRFVAFPILAALSCSTAWGQTAAAPSVSDYIITTAGDTLRGTVTAGRFVSENGLSFRPAAGGGRTYYPKELRGFGLADGRRFVAHRMLIRSVAGGRPAPQDSTTVLLQQLTTGAARLYRLDYNVVPDDATALNYTRYENTFFFIQTATPTLRGDIILLQRATYQQVLASVFSSCPEATNRLGTVRFEQLSLANAALRYGSCTPALPAKALFVAPSTPTHLSFGLQFGANHSSLYYPNEPYLTRDKLQTKPGWTAGVYLRLGTRTGVSALGVGLQYSLRQASAQSAQVVPAGYTNAGQTLQLRSELSAQTLQIPVFYQLASTKSWGPFANVGIAPGVAFGSRGSQEKTASVIDPAQPFLPRLSVKAAAEEGLTTGQSAMWGGFGGVGVRPALGNSGRRLLLEIGYELGTERRKRQNSSFSYAGAFLRAGIEL